MSIISVGVSGGVDSAATVLMLKKKGFEVKGVHFSVLKNEDVEYINRLSETLGIEIVDHNIAELFDQRIIVPFVNGYINGATPSPCVECNPLIKWSVVREYGESIGATRWATGHYARAIVHDDGFYYVAKGVDPLKDQSYYLWKLDQSTLAGAIMPLGERLKNETKQYMSDGGYNALSSQKESMGVCFLRGRSYKELIRSRVADIDKLIGGDIVTRSGDIVGSHDGYPFYTIAQYKGLNLSKGLCVVEIDVKQNRLIVGNQSELYTDSFLVENYMFVNIHEIAKTKLLEVKVRGIGRNPTGYCNVDFLDSLTLNVKLSTDKVWAVAKGQPVVFYISDRVVGGGYAK